MNQEVLRLVSQKTAPVFDTGTNVKEIAKIGKFEVDGEGNVRCSVETFIGKTPEVENPARADVGGTVTRQISEQL